MANEVLETLATMAMAHRATTKSRQPLPTVTAAPQAHPTFVCIDGPAGSGKTTLAMALAGNLGAQTIHMDDLYAGWAGIEEGAQLLVDQVLEPLSRGVAGRYRRFDWNINEYAEEHLVPKAEWLVVEGCASATKLVDKFEPFIIWVEADDSLRLERGLNRDGHHLRDHWLQFMRTEREIYQANHTKSRAHVRLNGFGKIQA